MITINMRRACCGVLGNVFAKIDHSHFGVGHGSGPLRYSARLRRGALEPLGIVVGDSVVRI